MVRRGRDRSETASRRSGRTISSTGAAGTSLVVAAAGVLANDIDPDVESLTATETRR